MHATDAKTQKIEPDPNFFLWRTKVLEAVCKRDWYNVRSYLFFNVRKFRTKILDSVCNDLKFVRPQVHMKCSIWDKAFIGYKVTWRCCGMCSQKRIVFKHCGLKQVILRHWNTTSSARELILLCMLSERRAHVKLIFAALYALNS